MAVKARLLKEKKGTRKPNALMHAAGGLPTEPAHAMAPGLWLVVGAVAAALWGRALGGDQLVVACGVAVGVAWVFRRRSLLGTAARVMLAGEEAARAVVSVQEKNAFAALCNGGLRTVCEQVLVDVQRLERAGRKRIKQLLRTTLLPLLVAFKYYEESVVRHAIRGRERAARRRLHDIAALVGRRPSRFNPFSGPSTASATPVAAADLFPFAYHRSQQRQPAARPEDHALDLSRIFHTHFDPDCAPSRAGRTNQLFLGADRSPESTVRGEKSCAHFDAFAPSSSACADGTKLFLGADRSPEGAVYGEKSSAHFDAFAPSSACAAGRVEQRTVQDARRCDAQPAAPGSRKTVEFSQVAPPALARPSGASLPAPRGCDPPNAARPSPPAAARWSNWDDLTLSPFSDAPPYPKQQRLLDPSLDSASELTVTPMAHPLDAGASLPGGGRARRLVLHPVSAATTSPGTAELKPRDRRTNRHVVGADEGRQERGGAAAGGSDDGSAVAAAAEETPEPARWEGVPVANAGDSPPTRGTRPRGDGNWDEKGEGGRRKSKPGRAREAREDTNWDSEREGDRRGRRQWEESKPGRAREAREPFGEVNSNAAPCDVASCRGSAGERRSPPRSEPPALEVALVTEGTQTDPGRRRATATVFDRLHQSRPAGPRGWAAKTEPAAATRAKRGGTPTTTPPPPATRRLQPEVDGGSRTRGRKPSPGSQATAGRIEQRRQSVMLDPYADVRNGGGSPNTRAKHWQDSLRQVPVQPVTPEDRHRNAAPASRRQQPYYDMQRSPSKEVPPWKTPPKPAPAMMVFRGSAGLD
ncbi:hypothetical protein DIPPA_13017 [Diplonema papillatum]|nr:hypothetical protein DIPPA_13017 [Diplonema papillatum]